MCCQVAEKASGSSHSNVNQIFYEPQMSFVESKNTNNPSASEQLIASAKYTNSVQEKLCAFFYHYSFPSEYLNLRSFRALMQFLFSSDAINAENDTSGLFKYKNYFYAFDASQKSIITFNDFLLGLAAMEPITQHGGVPAEQRCRYIFRYYTYNQSSNHEYLIENPTNNSNLVNSMTFEQFK